MLYENIQLKVWLLLLGPHTDKPYRVTYIFPPTLSFLSKITFFKLLCAFPLELSCSTTQCTIC